MKKPHLPMAREGHAIQAPLPAWAIDAANASTIQVVPYTAASASSTVVLHTCVILTSTTNCWVKWSPSAAAAVAAVVATAGNIYLAAGIPRAMANRPGFYSAIRDSADGTLVVEPQFED